jgi:GAF domain-containing protein
VQDIDVESCLANLSRLDALNATGLMDQPPRPDLDDLAKRAAVRLNTPMAFMSLLDDRRVFLAGAAGVTGEMAETRQNSAEASYCQYVVALDDVLVVNNALADPLVADHPGTTEGGVRAYLGVPLRKGGFCLGSFCVVDDEARDWTDDDLAALQRLADEAMTKIGA